MRNRLLQPALILLFILIIACTALAQQPMDDYSQNDLRAQRTAFEEQLRLATSGDAAAQYALSYIYEAGRGVEQSNSEARRWLESSARNGYPQAMLSLAQALNEEKNYADALPWFLKASQDGVTGGSAEYWIAVYYDDGDGVSVDRREAFKWYSKAAAQGHAQAMRNLGMFYVEGDAVERSYEKAMQWYQRAAELGDDVSLCGIGLLYYNGLGVQQDYKKAAQWFEQAADRGDKQAQFTLGYMLVQGIGGKTDNKAGMDWIQRSAAQGYEPAVMMFSAAVIDGTAGEGETIADTLQQLQPLAEKGEPTAELLMGLAQLKNAQPKLAIEWLEKSLLHGNGFAAHSLAGLYQRGTGVPKDLKRAGEHYVKSVELQEHPELLNDASWFFSTIEDEKFRNPELALRYALRAVQLSEEEQAAILDTLAEAYFVNHDYQQAIAVELRALQLEPTRPEFQKSLARFQKMAAEKAPISAQK